MASLLLSDALKLAEAQAVINYIGNNAQIRLYSGTAPTTVAGVITGTLLGTLSISGAFGTATGAGVITVGAFTNSTAVADGTVTHARIFTSGGVAVYQLDVATSNASLNVPTTTVTTGLELRITSLVINE
jgi:hypothetical protein